MAGTGRHTDHQSRLDWWRRQIQRQRMANLTVTDFCRQLGVSVTTFYYWKRRVHGPSPTAPVGGAAEHPSRHLTASASDTAANFGKRTVEPYPRAGGRAVPKPTG